MGVGELNLKKILKCKSNVRRVTGTSDGASNKFQLKEKTKNNSFA